MPRASGPSVVVRAVVAVLLVLTATACGSDGASPAPSSASPAPTATVPIGAALPAFGAEQADLVAGDGEVFVAVDGDTAAVLSATGAALPTLEYAGDVCQVAVHGTVAAREVVVAAVSEVTGSGSNGIDQVTLHVAVHDARSGEVVYDVVAGDEESGLEGHCAGHWLPTRIEFSTDGRYALIASAPVQDGGVLLDLDTGDVSATQQGEDYSFQALVGGSLLRAADPAATIEIVDPATGADGPATGTVASSAPFDQVVCDVSPDACIDPRRQTTAAGELVLVALTAKQSGVPVPYVFPGAAPRYPTPDPNGTTVQVVPDQLIVEPDTDTVVAIGLQDGGTDSLVGYDVATGRRLWVTPTTGYVGLCAAAGGGVLVAQSDELMRYDARTGAATIAGDDGNCPVDLGGGFGYRESDRTVTRYL